MNKIAFVDEMLLHDLFQNVFFGSHRVSLHSTQGKTLDHVSRSGTGFKTKSRFSNNLNPLIDTYARYKTSSSHFPHSCLLLEPLFIG